LLQQVLISRVFERTWSGTSCVIVSCPTNWSDVSSFWVSTLCDETDVVDGVTGVGSSDGIEGKELLASEDRRLTAEFLENKTNYLTFLLISFVYLLTIPFKCNVNERVRKTHFFWNEFWMSVVSPQKKINFDHCTEKKIHSFLKLISKYYVFFCFIIYLFCNTFLFEAD
jgi:hypothetical protein